MGSRVNPNVLPDLLDAISQAQQNAQTAVQEVATGRSVNNLSDNPGAAAAYCETLRSRCVRVRSWDSPDWSVPDARNWHRRFLEWLRRSRGRLRLTVVAL